MSIMDWIIALGFFAICIMLSLVIMASEYELDDEEFIADNISLDFEEGDSMK